MQPRLLDLFCGAGGATRGYQLAGFHVTGVDIAPQPNFVGDEFVQADALTFPVHWFDAVHASPTCQTFARVTAWRGSRSHHPDLLAPMLERLALYRIPWVVENVPEAPLRPDYLLCGTQFGLNVRRHRVFQRGNWNGYELLPPCQCYRNRRVLPFMHKGERAYADAMGCGWMSAKEARQAIPPDFTKFIGEQLMAHLTAGVRT
jgi:DNA (cytosine-5)-methyltransferase 1